jgi:CelD/BcsL family acetyltransferase involved in cellulose biosynthesis/RimJ/RimL family protein N-acetyltransferase
MATDMKIYSGNDARRLLSDPHFIERWKRLHADCTYATAFQGPAFVRSWYDAYSTSWQPVIAVADSKGQDKGEDGELDALWLLAYHDASNTLAHAGSHQAEYHVWLARDGMELPFLSSAWPALRRQYQFSVLKFKYLPSSKLVEILKAVPGLGDGLGIRLEQRPLMRLDEAEIKASFAKKSNKSRFNRLKKAGSLEFRPIRSAAELDEVFDEIIVYYDLRQGGVNQVTPFRDDPRKKKFHANLFSQGEDTRVTVTYLDGKPIAAFWGAVSGSTVHLGMLAYSPLLAEHSPGKLHVMQLSEYLLAEGMTVLDLTPGGDAWKERFANMHDEVAYVVAYSSALGRQTANGVQKAAEMVKRGAAVVGMTPSDLREFLRKVGRARPDKVARKFKDWADTEREYRLYYRDTPLLEGSAPDGTVARNALADLLCFRPGESWQSKEAFLSSALYRLESGETVYTVRVGDQLAHVGWMVRNQSVSYLTEVQQEVRLPQGNVCLYDFYTHPDFRGKGFYRATIRAMLRDAFSDPSIRHCFISVLADNKPSRHVIEDLGFKHHASFYWKQKFGSTEKWADDVAVAGQEPVQCAD